MESSEPFTTKEGTSLFSLRVSGTRAGPGPAGATAPREAKLAADRQARGTVNETLYLQRTLGNQATLALLRRGEASVMKREPRVLASRSCSGDVLVQRADPLPVFVPAPAPGVTPPSPPVPDSPEAAKAEAFNIGLQWGGLFAERDVALMQLRKYPLGGKSIWDGFTDAQKKAWVADAQDILVRSLPPLPHYDRADQTAAQEDGFKAGFEASYSLAQLGAFMVSLGTELAISFAISFAAGLAARGGKLLNSVRSVLRSGGQGAQSALPDAEAFIKARSARNAMVEVWKGMPKVQQESIATITGGVNVTTGEVTAAYNTTGKCAEDVVVEQLGGDASKVRFSEAVRPRTGQQVPVCERCQQQYDLQQFPEGVIFGGPGVTMPKAGQ
jgi:hypothetical protein